MVFGLFKKDKKNKKPATILDKKQEVKPKLDRKLPKAKPSLKKQ